VSGAAARLDAMPEPWAREALMRCCGCRRWVEDMLAARPFGDDEAVTAAAARLWADAGPDEVLEALGHHPEIGADLGRLRERFANTAGWASAEQAGVGGADDATLVALQAGNIAYKERFGFVFVVCATGKSAAEMLALLQARLINDRTTELANAAREQGAITRLRLAKLADG
jgi:2-oxo-4-hydroxy-4-carboxy-5-ureidoimidazoline decarboxylase